MPSVPEGFFTGREEWIRRIRKALYPGRPVALPQVINAPDGSGKTALAIEYARRYGGEYDIVWWIDADEPALIKFSLLRLAAGLGFFVDITTALAEVVAALDSYLKKNTNWLIIFDNVTDSEALRDLVPIKTKGHIIGTTAVREWPNVAEMNDIDTPPPAEAAGILEHELDTPAGQSPSELCDRLAYLPLAMRIAARHIRESNISIEQYMEDYNRNLIKALNRDTLLENRTHPALAAACDTSLTGLAREIPSILPIIRFCSFLAPGDIPAGLIDNLEQRIPPTMKSLFPDDYSAPAAGEALVARGLAEGGGDSIRFHPGVQGAVAESMSGDERAAWASAAAAVMYDVISDDSAEPDPLTGLPAHTAHALAAARRAASLTAPGPAAVDILNNTGELLFNRGDLDSALGLFRIALDFDEKTLGGHHPNVAVHLNNIGSVLCAQENFDEARHTLERALQVDMAVHGDNHPTVATDLNTLGGVNFSMGYHEAARHNFKLALNIDKACYGPNHPVTASRMKNLGASLHALGDHHAARSYLEDALDIESGHFGLDSPDIVVCLNYLAGVYQSLAMFEEARDLYSRVLAIDEKHLDPDHPHIGVDLNNLGGVLRAMGEKKAARKHFDRALKICIRQLGRDHPSTLLIKENIDSL